MPREILRCGTNFLITQQIWRHHLFSVWGMIVAFMRWNFFVVVVCVFVIWFKNKHSKEKRYEEHQTDENTRTPIIIIRTHFKVDLAIVDDLLGIRNKSFWQAWIANAYQMVEDEQRRRSERETKKKLWNDWNWQVKKHSRQYF